MTAIPTSAMTPTIGVFDSGFGGLTVLRALIERLPHARFAFLGDTARLPYGSKSRRTIARYAAESAQFLVREQGAEFLVIACNTASALALDAIQDAVPVPVLGVIEPGAMAARQASTTGNVLVIATDATVHSHAYAAACHAQGLRALEKACPLLVPLVEEGWTDHPVTAEVIRNLSERIARRSRFTRAEARHAGSRLHALPAAAAADRARGAPGSEGDRFRRSGGAGRSRALQRARDCPILIQVRVSGRGKGGSDLKPGTAHRDSLFRHRFCGKIRAPRIAIPRAARGPRGIGRPRRVTSPRHQEKDGQPTKFALVF